jgi:DNA replication protein DnaC
VSDSKRIGEVIPGEFLSPYPFVEHGPQCPVCAAELCTSGRCIDCEDRAHAVQRDRWLASSDFGNHVPARWQWARFAAPELADRVRDTRATDQAMALGAGASAAFVGQPGSGKTTLAVCVARQRVREGVRVYFATAHDLARARAAYGLGEGEPDIVREAVRAKLLILDDLGQEPLTQQSAVTDVIYARHNAMRPTLVTTGMSPAAMSERYGGGTARRVYEPPIVTIQVRGARV